MRVAIAYEPVCINGVHAPFAAGMLESLLAVYDRVVFVADATEIPAVRNLVESGMLPRVDWQVCSVALARDSRPWRRLLGELRILNRVIKLARDNDAKLILGFSFTRPGLAVAKLYSWLRVPHVDFGVVAHMILATLSTSRRDRWLVRFGQPKRFRILVLGKSTLTAALSAFVGTDQLFRAVTHPYPMADAPTEVVAPDGSHLVFGFPGLASEGKGFSTFLNIAEQLHSATARFVVVGRLLDDCPVRERAMDLVSHGALSILRMGAEQLSTDDFRRELQLLNYLICPHSAEAYGLVQSGVVLDAVWSARPLIATRIPIFEELFDRAGDVGYLCSTESEFIATVRLLISTHSTSKYERETGNLIAARRYFSATEVGAELLEALAVR